MPLYTLETYGELRPHLEQEWLLTNGTGAYASGTVVGCNTRRYHGLLCAATLPPVGRVMLLNRVAEIINVNDDMYDLSINQFGEEYHPRGEKNLRKFQLGQTAVWEYEAGGVKITKELMLLWGRNAIAVRYTVNPLRHRRAELQVLPFVSLRDFHALRRAWAPFATEPRALGVRVRDDESKLGITIAADQGKFIPKTDWWYAHTYKIEADRGQDRVEDLYTPGRFQMRFESKGTLTLVAGLDDVTQFDWDAELATRQDAYRRPVAPAPAKATAPSPTFERLAHAAADFVVARTTPSGEPGTTIIAGYPWFADWGRDTMIALPGLLLTTRRFEQARQVLGVFASYVSDGMIPNRFDDYTNKPEYNTVDASLWFIHACYEYLRLTQDNATFDKSLRPACDAIVEGYRKGTRYGIHMDEADALITQGDATTQLTWMDAKTGDTAFTPRQGKPVEINALWYHALRLTGRNDLADRVKESFGPTFWINPFRGLADVVDGDRKDTAIRPNQIFAASLANSPLTRDQQLAVVEVVRRELLTPFGLRTLAQSDSGYKPRYGGPQYQRDAAYHNGTIWPWPLGAFLDAYLRVNERSTASVEQAKEWLTPLIEGMHHIACIGQLSEIYEAAEPHRPAGCPAQAWSVAEVLRLAVALGM
jgi:predicted glycogen debranching enzyme